ncbi:MAG: sugar phosphate isomerase/epimerase family protein [Bacillota bacterium]|nr:sugar phosphate isomerase/epimerase family protein [Bacillota bacterium]
MCSWGIVTDELLADPVEAIHIAAEWGLKTIELRGIGKGRRIPDIEPDEVNRIKEALKETGLTVSALSPGTWKCSWHEPEAEQQADRFRRTLELAEQLDVKRIITFSVRRDSKDDKAIYDQIRDTLGSMSTDAAARGMTLCIENEKNWWADTETAIKRLLTDLHDAGLRLNWDAANYVDAGGHDALTTWKNLRAFIANIHLKDVVVVGQMHRWCRLGEGQVGWTELLPAMLASDPVTMSIETHCPPLLENSLINRNWLRQFEASD